MVTCGLCKSEDVLKTGSVREDGLVAFRCNNCGADIYVQGEPKPKPSKPAPAPAPKIEKSPQVVEGDTTIKKIPEKKRSRS